MDICKVIGVAVSTIKDQKINGFKLLICQEESVLGRRKGSAFVAVDSIGAGKGDLVLVVKGAPAQDVVGAPVDAAIISIIDNIEV
jgi:microcompartment protein CcmK/EutM